MLLNSYSVRKKVWDIKNKNLQHTPLPSKSAMNLLLLATCLMLVMKRNRDAQGDRSPQLPVTATATLTSFCRRAWPTTRREKGTLRPGSQIQQSLWGIGLVSSLFQSPCWAL